MVFNAVLADSSFLFALANPRDKFRKRAVEFARSSNETQVIPDVVLTEVTHLLKRSISYQAVQIFVESVILSPAQLERVTKDDLSQALAIMHKYADIEFYFVDCCIMALAERLNITHICIFDDTDFRVYRPTHCDHLILLP